MKAVCLLKWDLTRTEHLNPMSQVLYSDNIIYQLVTHQQENYLFTILIYE